ncbi:MAG: type II and III secretion system protein family protein [Gluconacetobacter diazotrophicus]|nr:type II and III secretion system protein family protein [Gluconacetobacter diazotrophicus]
MPRISASSRTPFLLAALLSGTAAFGTLPARAQDAGAGRIVSLHPEVDAANRTLTLEAGLGKLIELHQPAANVFIANPKVVDVRPAGNSTFFLFGLAPGRSTVTALDGSGGRIAAYDVSVLPSSYNKGEARAALDRALPGNAVALRTTDTGLAAAGTLPTPDDAARAQAAIATALPKGGTLDSRIAVTESTQVLLRVRVAEMSRDVTRTLGVNWQAVGTLAAHALANVPTAAVLPAAATFAVGYFNTGINVNAVIDALAQDNSAHLLAEPDLMAMSGQPADFLVGGEYPVPVSSSLGQINVTYKEYGVKLDFVPTVMDSGRIQLHVRPEVSALSNQGAVQTGTGSTAIVIPALTVRRADTTVELGSGQSFAIAGMLQKNTLQTDSGIPILGDLPLVGGLFRSDNFDRLERELVIIVTPYLVKPTDDPKALRTPGEGFAPPNDLERVLLLRQASLDAPNRAENRSFPSDAGFLVR